MAETGRFVRTELPLLIDDLNVPNYPTFRSDVRLGSLNVDQLGVQGQSGGDDAEKEVGSVVCAGDQMERGQSEKVSRRIQAVARGCGRKE